MLLNKSLKATAFVLVTAAYAMGLVLLQSAEPELPRRAAAAEVGNAAQDNNKSRLAAEGGDAAKDVSELDKLKGVWVCVGYERDGQTFLDQQAKEAMWNETLWFQAGPAKNDPLNLSWERKGNQTSAAAVFTLRPAKPQAIDLTWRSIPAHAFMPKGIDPAWEQATVDETKLDRVQPGIYAIEGNRLRLCWGELGGDRPTSLKTKRGDKGTIHVYERKKE